MPPKHARTDTGGKRKPHNRTHAQSGARPVRPQAHRKELSVNKIKAQLRRARFILSKDGVGADVRQEAERQEAALLADLQRAEERAAVARTAQRYHKVKFIERTKVERQVAKLKRRLAEAEGKEKKIAAQIVDARVLLHYIITFPPELKYVSLLQADLSSAKRREAHATSGNAALKAAMDFHQKVREQFEAGQLEPEPEIMLSDRYQAKRQERRLEHKELKTHQKSDKSSGKPAPASAESLEDNGSDSDSEKSDESNSDSSSSSSSSSTSNADSASESESESDAPPPKRTRLEKGKQQDRTAKKFKPSAKSGSDAPRLPAAPPTIEGDDFFDV